eukprot:TRINITY_DN714_c0_g1_i2.p1 TRINITY_DN714_c0_g1~~TRINITY_DN714_c0_g1_i2.p1  ORF type:complete len:766 (+),score=172.16 TRINITY_DN714_c0_g1_i2:34-2298(+)
MDLSANLVPHDDSDSSDYLSELDGRPRRRRQPRYPGQPRIPQEAQALLGQANDMYAAQNYERAVELLTEVIRLAPSNSHAYSTLGLIYEGLNDTNKAVQFYIFAAHLSRDDSLWKRIGQLSLQINDLRQALYCFKRALRINPQDLESMWERSQIFIKMQLPRRAIDSLLMLLSRHPGDSTVRVELAKLYLSLHQAPIGISILEWLIPEEFLGHPPTPCPDDTIAVPPPDYVPSLNMDSVHVLAELYEANKQFEQTIYMLQHLQLYQRRQDPPQELPVELIISYGVAETNLGLVDEAERHFAVLSEAHYDVATYGDLYLYVAEAYMAVQQYARALEVLNKLLSTVEYDAPAVWLKAATCTEKLGREDDAISAYQKVVERVPGNGPACVALMRLYGNRSARYALEFLEEQMPDDGVLQVTGSDGMQLLYMKAELHYKLDDRDEFVTTAQALLSSVVKRRRRRGPHSDRETAEDYGEDQPADDATTFAALVEQFGEQVLVGLLQRTVKILASTDRAREAQQLVTRTVAHAKIDEALKEDLRLMAVSVALDLSDYAGAYESVKVVCAKRPDDLLMWELLNDISARMNMDLDVKLLTRMLIRHPNSLPVLILAGNFGFLGGYLRLAMGEYLYALESLPTEPLLHLLMGCCYLTRVMAKGVTDRHFVVMQAFAYMFKYAQLREYNQEACYNLGRAFHQMSIFHLAVYFYERALKCAPAPMSAGSGETDLTTETALNLYSILMASDSKDLARDLMEKYLVI